jgi:hypothetical protein
MAREPDRVGPSLMLYLKRWEEVDRLNRALHDGDPPWKLDPSDREKALAVIDTANWQAETLLRRAMEEGVGKALDPDIRFILPHKLQGKIRNEWWTGYGEIRRSGPGRPRPAGWIELALIDSPDLHIYFAIEGAERSTSVQNAMRKLARRVTAVTVAYEDFEDGPALEGKIPLEEGKRFDEVIAGARNWTDVVVAKEWPRIEAAVRSA